MGKEYKATIESTIRNLSTAERIKYKNFTNANGLNELVKTDGRVLLEMQNVIHLRIENEYSKTKEYDVYLIVDKDGEVYQTSSDSCWRCLNDIIGEFQESDDGLPDVLPLVFYGQPSKNFAGNMLLCNLA